MKNFYKKVIKKLITIKNRVLLSQDSDIFDIENIYTPISEAATEIRKRWDDDELKKKVEKFWGGHLPEIIKDEPRALFFRVILTPNFETKYFLDLVNLIKIKPLCLEFHSDKFCSMNKDKVHLGKLMFLSKNDDGMHCSAKKRIIIDFDNSEKKTLRSLKTTRGNDLIDFHHNLYIKHHKEMIDLFDISGIKDDNKTAQKVYEKIFSLCLVYGVLFENFIEKDSEHEKKFTETVIKPALKSTIKRFGLKPLVIPLLPLKNEEHERWVWYPEELEKEIDLLF